MGIDSRANRQSHVCWSSAQKSEVTLPLYFKFLITNTCGRCPADKPPGMMHAIPGQSAFTREHNEPRWRNRLSTRLLSPRATYLATFVAWVFSEDHIRYDYQFRHSAHAIPGFSHPAQSQQAPRREPSTGTPSPTCQPSLRLPGLLARNQRKGRRMR